MDRSESRGQRQYRAAGKRQSGLRDIDADKKRDGDVEVPLRIYQQFITIRLQRFQRQMPAEVEIEEYPDPGGQ